MWNWYKKETIFWQCDFDHHQSSPIIVIIIIIIILILILILTLILTLIIIIIIIIIINSVQFLVGFAAEVCN